MTLVSKRDIEVVLRGLDVNEYYANIDMNGAISIFFSPDDQDKIDAALQKFVEVDIDRTTDDIYKTNDILYPLKRISVDYDDDNDTIDRLDGKDIKQSRFSQQLNSWVSSKYSDKEAKVPRVAFYSYKGGVGRSTTLAIVARLLAKEGLKVAVLDLDLEAPGLNSLLLTKPKPSPFGVVDYLYHVPWSREQIDQKRFLSQYVVREDVPRRNKRPGQIIVMSAGGTIVDEDGRQLRLLFDEDEVDIKLEPNYLQKLSFIDFDVYSRQATNIFDSLLNDMADYTGADIILFDARTGFSNVSGALLNQFSDVLSIHVQNNQQNKEGIEFISKYIHKEKLQNTIWSNTKQTPEERELREGKELKEFINSMVYDVDDGSSMCSYYELPFVRNLDNINAHRLKNVIETDRPFINPYVTLSEQILIMTNLNKKLPNYIDETARLNIITDLQKVIEKQSETVYISQRFLSEDLELYVGFPGSGKSTFKNYMKSRYGIDAEVIDFETFDSMESSAHRILSHMVFLDWNFDEATQAVCKWILHSEEFFNWLVNNPQLKEYINSEELKQMRGNAEFELEPKVANEILEIVFQAKGRHFQGWRSIFSLLQYREGFVLPFDIMSGVKSYISYWAGKYISKEHKASSSGRAIFPLPSSNMFFKEIWKDIGLSKLEWLSNFDANLVKLIYAIKETKQEYRLGEKTSVENSKFVLRKSLFNLSDEEFESLFEKAKNMEIIRKRHLKSFQMISLSPVYQLIEV